MINSNYDDVSNNSKKEKVFCIFYSKFIQFMPNSFNTNKNNNNIKSSNSNNIIEEIMKYPKAIKGVNILFQLKENMSFALPGGYIEEGEIPIDALQREVKEEVGILIPKNKFKYLFKVVDTYIFSYELPVGEKLEDYIKFMFSSRDYRYEFIGGFVKSFYSCDNLVEMFKNMPETIYKKKFLTELRIFLLNLDLPEAYSNNKLFYQSIPCSLDLNTNLFNIPDCFIDFNRKLHEENSHKIINLLFDAYNSNSEISSNNNSNTNINNKKEKIEEEQQADSREENINNTKDNNKNNSEEFDFDTIFKHIIEPSFNKEEILMVKEYFRRIFNIINK